jgi:hypothetical protein
MRSTKETTTVTLPAFGLPGHIARTRSALFTLLACVLWAPSWVPWLRLLGVLVVTIVVIVLVRGGVR